MSSVVVVRRPHSLNIFPSETTGPIQVRFHMELLWDRGTQVCSNVPSHINKLAAMPIYGKNLKQSSSPKPKKPMTLNLGMHHRVLKYFQVCSNDDLGLTLTYHEKPEDHWSCIAHLSVEDILRSGLLRKRSLKVLNMSDLDQGQ